MPALIDLVGRGVLSPKDAVQQRYPLDQVASAYQHLAEGKIVGRAVVDIAATTA
jgi:Zn-dependent alcohol dehydrogenase